MEIDTLFISITYLLYFIKILKCLEYMKITIGIGLKFRVVMKEDTQKSLSVLVEDSFRERIEEFILRNKNE